MNMIHLNKDIEVLDKIPDYSQIAIYYDGIDSIHESKKFHMVNSILKKIRKDGELTISLTDYSKVIEGLSKNLINIDEGLSILKQIEHSTEPMSLINYIISLEPNIILYKMIEENFKTVLTLKRIQY